MDASKCAAGSVPRVLDLLRPPPHRGPLIAAGAVVLATGLALLELRLEDELAVGVHFLILATVAAIVLTLGLQAPNEDGRPPAYQSVLLVTGLLLLYPALLRLSATLGAEDFTSDFPAGELTWTSLVLAGVALFAAVRRRSAVCLLIAAIAGTLALLSAWEWIFATGSFTPSRWLLLVTATALALGSLALRAGSPRQAELLVDGAGLALLFIGLQGIFVTFFADGALPGTDPALPGFWELIVFGAGCGLVAFGAIDRSPGPAWLGFANLAVFVIAVGFGSEATLYFWPLALILVGAVAMAAGLRPRQPLPPEPDAYRAGEQPLASRTAEDEVVMRVRVDDAPPPGGSVSGR
jgi:hypothetical protein